jgi:UDP-N-acetylmuramoyl-tripeptide--D-alanyl-D-alanine ligase
MIDRFISNVRAAYGWHSASILVALYSQASYNPFRYFAHFWTTQNFASIERRSFGLGSRLLVDTVRIGMLLQIGIGVWLCFWGVQTTNPAAICFGVAALISYPLVWAHVLPILSAPALLLGIKPLGKRVLAWLLERQVVALRRKHAFTVVAVAGSVGKTSTKLAIVDALSVARRVQYQSGNYNVRLTVPLIFFGHDEPGIYNVFAWLKILLANYRMIRQEYPYDVVVVELAPGGIGSMEKFAYLRPDLGVLTSVAPEHMEVFETIEKVAREETTLLDFCKKNLVNSDDVDKMFLEDKEYITYGGKDAVYSLESAKPAKKLGAQDVRFNLAGRQVSSTISLAGQQGAKVALAAVAAASELALAEDDVKAAFKQLKPFAGRMQILPGIEGSTIIDDTYNASPLAVKAALDVLYDADTSQRIALLGAMNEMGEYSGQAHVEIGEYCDPDKLDLVVTLGKDANTFLAPAAQARGCRVERVDSPYQAATLIASQLKKKAVVLAKGSQNGVFAEEAVKGLLANPDDAKRLVRQSGYWMKIKQRQFNDPQPS